MTVPDGGAPADPIEALADRHLVERGRRYLRKIRLRLLRRELECGTLRRREEELRLRLSEAEEAARLAAPEREALRAEIAALRGQLEAARSLAETAERERDEARAAVQERAAAAAQAEVGLRAVHEALEASRRETADGRAALEGLRRLAGAAAAERDAARAELDRVHSSRLWRAGTAYWRLLRSLGLLRGAVPAPPARTEVQTPAAAPEPAPGAGLPLPAPLAVEAAPAAVEPRPVPAEPPPAPEPAAPAPEAAEADAAADPFESARPSAYDVVCFSIIEWGFRYQRPQQLLAQFAAHGHRVFYVSQVFRPDGPPFVLTPVRPNVVEVTLRGPAKNIYQDSLEPSELDALFESLDALRRELGLGATVSLVELPFWWPLAERARARLAWPVVYDCMDYHPGFSTNDTAMLEREDALISGADLVSVSSAFLEREVGRHARRLVRVPNACDYDAFASVPPPPRGPSPVVGYYGAIADWFDSDLVADLAERRPDWRFLLVGSTFTADLSRLSKLPNVELPGEVPYADLPGWIARMDVLLIPFRRTELTEATNPVKAYEILAAGRPLVSVPLPEVVAMGDLVRLAGTAEEMEREVQSALRTDGEAARDRRRAFAREQTWSHRFEALAPEVAASFPRISVVVVTYNNRDWNERCLVSLRERNEWPNLEIVVVDNASKDGSPELLREQAALDERIRLVLNQENRGFAAANNQGLALSSGRVLVLLNNDTVATRGFLASFTRHLLADPTIGLLGASTNEIANEARVDEVGYGDLEELHPWAADFVREHDGQLEDLSMLAMFCIAWTRETFERIGELDERFVVGMFEDDDYAKRAHELGLRTVVARDAFVHHAGRASFKSIGDARYFEIFETNRARFQEKWGLWLPHVTKHARSMVGPFRKELAWRMEQAGADPGRVVVFLPAVGWNISLVQRPHHLARAFARRGWFVLFDCTNSAAEDFGGFQEVEPRLLLFRGPTEILTDLPEPPVLWTLPYNASLVDSWKRRRVVYDCIDDLKVFPYNQKLLERAHERMLREADAVLCVSRPLLDEVRKSRPDALYVPNAVDVDHFAKLPEDAPRPEALKRVLEDGRPVVGYYGAIASWLDVEMVESAARLRPDWSFVLLGQRLLDAPPLDRLEALPNVFVLPPQRYEAIPSVLACFDVAFIPFAVNDITHATSPLKLFEYFAGGKPVLSSPMPECAAFPEVRIVASGRQLAEALDPALLDSWDAAHRARLRKLAAENSWSARAGSVMAALGVEAVSSSPERSVPRAPETERPALPASVGPGGALAARFASLRTSGNARFFDAIARHLEPAAENPMVGTYFDFALSCNERGRRAGELLESLGIRSPRSVLDVGCAYGGFLVAFGKRGARVAGIETDPKMIGLARTNLEEQGISATLVEGDASDPVLAGRVGSGFELVTCNDVLEHVDEPFSLISNVARLLAPGGTAYFEVPNSELPAFVRADGHYGIFGISLLPYQRASALFEALHPGVRYTVRHYLPLPEVFSLLEQAGLVPELLASGQEGSERDAIRREVRDLLEQAPSLLEGIPEGFRDEVRATVEAWARGVLEHPGDSTSVVDGFQTRFGISFWRILARKPSEPEAKDQGAADASAAGAAAPSSASPPGADAVPSEGGRRGHGLDPARLDSPDAVHGAEPRPLVAEASWPARSTPATVARDVETPPAPDPEGKPSPSGEGWRGRFRYQGHHVAGSCNVCGEQTQFTFEDPKTFRESLVCASCGATSRYRSIARGVLRAIERIAGLKSDSLAHLPGELGGRRFRVLDTQLPFTADVCAYPIPDLLAACAWIDLELGVFRPRDPLGTAYAPRTTNQDLERLTFADASFDLVVTSDVMEHVRRDDVAHREIHRVLSEGGAYVFTVPYLRSMPQTLVRRRVVDPDDPSRDEDVLPPEYHGDANGPDGGVLAYRGYGTDLDAFLQRVGFRVEYSSDELPELGIRSTELFYCTKIPRPRPAGLPVPRQGGKHRPRRGRK